MRSFGRWACENHNVYTYNCPYVSADAIGFSYWNKLKGYMHTSAHAPIGSWRAAHLLVHAQYESCRNIGVRRMQHQMNERANSVQRTIGWAQTSCATPDRLQTPWRHVQGGVVGKGLGYREQAPMSVSHSRVMHSSQSRIEIVYWRACIVSSICQ